MATYYSYCRQFGLNFGECPVRRAGENCINCRNMEWILRKNVEKTSENVDSNTTDEKVSENEQ